MHHLEKRPGRADQALGTNATTADAMRVQGSAADQLSSRQPHRRIATVGVHEAVLHEIETVLAQEFTVLLGVQTVVSQILRTKTPH